MQPKSPNPDFDFMLKDNQQPKKGLAMPGLPKPAKIVLAVVAGIIILIIVSSLLSGRNKGSTQAFAGVMARGQEMLRVTLLAQQQLQFQDSQTQALAATVANSLASDQAQLKSYLSANHTKLSAAQLAADKNSATDTSLQTAAQNGGLDAAYVAYLKDGLSKYETDLQTAYKSAGPNGKKLLGSAFDSANTLLTNPPLKS